MCILSTFMCEPCWAQSAVADWSGLYVGAQFGGAVDRSEISDPLGPSHFGNPNLAPGPFAGANIGYNFQSGLVVYGLEADVNFGEMQGTSTCSSVSVAIITSNCRTGIDAFGSLTGKLGLAVGPEGRGLIYGKAGASWLNGELDLATNDATLGAAGNPFTTGSNSYTHWGWTLGAGAEYALTGPWSLKAEYDFARFGNQSVTLLPTANIAPSGAVIGSVPVRQGTVSQDLHVMKMGLTYRFGGDRLPDGGAGANTPPVSVANTGFEFELGGRYWYSWGRHKYDLGLITTTRAPDFSLISRLTYDDLYASTGEVFGRVSTPWNLFAKGFIGGGTTSGGHMNDEDFNIDVDGNQIPHTTTMSEASGDIPAYGTIDVGYEWWKSADFRFGTFVGYNYYRETIGAYGCWQLINQLGPCGTASDGNISTSGHPIITLASTWQSLRVGAAGEFYLAPGLKLTADAAYLPYVTVDSVDYHFFGNTASVASINPLTGHGVGTQIEAMLSYDVTQNWSIGVGARYWAMWTTEGYFERVYNAEGPVRSPPPHQHLKLETERAGVLGQLTYRFD